MFKYDGENMKHFDVEDGLASSEAYDIYIDDYDKVWVGTFGGGVAFYDGEVWSSLDTRDGLIGNTISAITSISGHLFFFAGGGGNGILNILLAGMREWLIFLQFNHPNK